MPTNFNIRVYGILLDSSGRILVSHERIRGEAYVKFPGGGLEPGEGPMDGLIREFQEELELTVSVDDLLYVTDFFIQSAFSDEDQIVSIYYGITSPEIGLIPIVDKWPEAEAVIAEKQIFQWVDPEDLKDGKLSFPGDRACLAEINASRLRSM